MEQRRTRATCPRPGPDTVPGTARWIREAETAPGIGGGWRTELSSQKLEGRARQVGDRSRGKGRQAGFAARATRAGKKHTSCALLAAAESTSVICYLL